MNKYEVTCLVNDNKVAIIKLIREFMDIGLLDAKRKVELTYGHDYTNNDIKLVIVVNDAQLGRAYARTFIDPHYNKVKILLVRSCPNAGYLDIS